VHSYHKKLSSAMQNCRRLHSTIDHEDKRNVKRFVNVNCKILKNGNISELVVITEALQFVQKFHCLIRR